MCLHQEKHIQKNLHHQLAKSIRLHNNDRFHLNLLLGSYSWKRKTNTLDYNITFTNMSILLIEDAYKTTYIKGQVKPWTCYLTTKKKVQDYFWITS